MALIIHAGQLTKTVVFKEPTDTRSDDGGKERTYTSAITARARIDQVNQQRALELNAPVLLNTDAVYVRYTTDRTAITKDWLITYYGKDHVIHSIELIDKEWIKLLVKND